METILNISIAVLLLSSSFIIGAWVGYRNIKGKVQEGMHEVVENLTIVEQKTKDAIHDEIEKYFK